MACADVISWAIKFSIFTWILFRGWSVSENFAQMIYFTITKHKLTRRILLHKSLYIMYCFVLLFRRKITWKIATLLSTFCYPFVFQKYFSRSFARVKFYGLEVLYYIARIIIHGKSQNPRNVIRAKINTVNSFKTEAVALQINGLVSIWLRPPSWKS